jgi:DNA repair protein RadD
VSRVTYGIHQKAGKPDSLKVDYWSGMRRVVSEWVCLSHEGYAGEKARAWWSKRAYGRSIKTGLLAIPDSTSQAIDWLSSSFPMRNPTMILVNESGKYPEIVGYQFPEVTDLRPDQLEAA